MSAPIVPRLCHLKKWPDFDGFGFTIGTKKGKHYIKVDKGSPAEATGLKELDRIVEIDGINIEMRSHYEVVQCIKAARQEIKLLVVDKETDQFFIKKRISLKSEMACVQTITCPAGKPGTLGTLVTWFILNFY